MGKTVFVGITIDGQTCVASATKAGMADRLGFSGKTMMRSMKGAVLGEWKIVRGGGNVLWRVCEIEVVQSRVKGNIENLAGSGGNFDSEV